MKKSILLILIAILGMAQVHAQTVGVIIQPEFGTDNVRKGFFIEYKALGKLGLYSDFKVMNNIFVNYKELQGGLSLQVLYNTKIIASTSLINEINYTSSIFPFTMNKQYRTYQIGLLHKVDFLSIIGSYEFDKHFGHARVSAGIGFNINSKYK